MPPAKAGTQGEIAKLVALDSRIRGNERSLVQYLHRQRIRSQRSIKTVLGALREWDAFVELD
jgi:hypothetical protein